MNNPEREIPSTNKILPVLGLGIAIAVCSILEKNAPQISGFIDHLSGRTKTATDFLDELETNNHPDVVLGDILSTIKCDSDGPYTPVFNEQGTIDSVSGCGGFNPDLLFAYTIGPRVNAICFGGPEKPYTIFNVYGSTNDSPHYQPGKVYLVEETDEKRPLNKVKKHRPDNCEIRSATL